MSDSEFRGFLEGTFRSVRSAVKPAASLYVCHSSCWQREFQNALEAAGFEIRCQIICAKHTFAWGFGRYKFQHEPIFYAHLVDKKDAGYGDKTQSTLWKENKPAANRIHPTANPVELVERALLNSSRRGERRCGSVCRVRLDNDRVRAAGRKARLMEIDPRYTDGIVRRYQEYTGKQAVLDGDGRCFDEIARERLKEAA
jgi:DNA modification methylase